LSYNYFIAGAALGAVIFLPGRLSLPVAALAGALAAFIALALQYMLGWSATSYLPVSSALAIWVGMGALTVAGEHAIVSDNLRPDQPPELVWWDTAYWRARYGRPLPLFAVPVAGELQVSQGFKGRISHTGAYRHALDFQHRTDTGGGAGSIWGAAVTAPAPGTVERTRDGVADNPLGVCNYAENWGNHVVIHLDAGGWAMLAHLQLGSVVVAPGARVETGSHLGRVGNSGRSPVPHLHLQLQSAAEPGSATRAFRLANYFTAKEPAAALTHWHASSVPSEGEVLMAARSHGPVFNALVGMAPGTAVWTCEVQGEIPPAFDPGQTRVQHLSVHMDSLGQQVLDAGDQGRLVLALDPDALRVKALEHARMPLLSLLAMAMASIPYATRVGTTWSDVAPAMPSSGWRRFAALLMAPYRPHPVSRVNYQCVSEPDFSGSPLGLVGTVVAPGDSLPHRLTCEWAPMRGPVKILVEFAAGALHFQLLSFEPGGTD
jgi:murein DD-endopeptidase MepM/ murein hydrolase activator NlpD